MAHLLVNRGRIRELYRRTQGVGYFKPVLSAVAEAALSGYGAWRPFPGKKFLILIQGRSGSSLLCDLLDSHPGIRCQSELLAVRLRAPMAYLLGMASFHSPSHAWGFKAKIQQIEQQSSLNSARMFLEHLNLEGWTLFSLSRENCVRSALSRLVAWRRGDRYHNFGKTAAELGKVYLEPERVLRAAWLDREERRRMLEVTQGLSSWDLTYEKNLQDSEAQNTTCERIFRILGADPVPVSSVFLRTSTGSISDSLVNAEEVVRAVGQSEFAEYL
jgi:hypothetical protein